jgi:siroheme synthase
MGLAARAAVAARLLARGWSPATPAAVVLGASTAGAFTWRGTLRELGAAPLAPDTDLPGTLVVGAVAALALPLRHAARVPDGPSATADGARKASP